MTRMFYLDRSDTVKNAVPTFDMRGLPDFAGGTRPGDTSASYDMSYLFFGRDLVDTIAYTPATDAIGAHIERAGHGSFASELADEGDDDPHEDADIRKPAIPSQTQANDALMSSALYTSAGLIDRICN